MGGADFRDQGGAGCERGGRAQGRIAERRDPGPGAEPADEGPDDPGVDGEDRVDGAAAGGGEEAGGRDRGAGERVVEGAEAGAGVRGGDGAAAG